MIYLFRILTNIHNKLNSVNRRYQNSLMCDVKIVLFLLRSDIDRFYRTFPPVFATSDIIIVTLSLQLSVCCGLQYWLFSFTSVDIGSLPDRALSQWVCTPACRWWEWLPSQKCEEFSSGAARPRRVRARLKLAESAPKVPSYQSVY